MSPIATRSKPGDARRASRYLATTARIVALAIVTLGSPAMVRAEPTDTARILLHIAPRTPQAGCMTGQIADPMQAVTQAGLTTGPGTFHNVYILAVKGTVPTLAGVEIGIRYQGNAAGGVQDGVGVDVLGWTLCADAEVRLGAWPASGGGNRIVWDSVNDCQEGPLSVAGYFYVGAYSADAMSLVGITGALAGSLADCGAQVHPVVPANLGVASFSPGAANPGCNPLLANCVSDTPVQTVTWSRVKSLVAGPRTP